MERTQISAPQDSDFQPTPVEKRNSELGSSVLSAEHPYYLRFDYNASGTFERGKARFILQLINLKTNSVIQIRDTHPNIASIVDGLEVFNSRSNFMAIPSADLLRVNIKTFAEIEGQKFSEIPKSESLSWTKKIKGILTDGLRNLVTHETLSPNQKGLLLKGPDDEHHRIEYAEPSVRNFTTPLIHTKPIEKMVVINWAPLVVTQTEDGLHIWNAKTGEIVSEITEAKWRFRVLDQMKILAYVLPDRHVGIYSLIEKRTLAIIPDIAQYSLESAIDHWQEGVAYVTNQGGHVFKIEEKVQDHLGSYSFADTGLKVINPSNGAFRTVVTTEKDTYFIVGYSESRFHFTKDTPLGVPLRVPENQQGDDLHLKIYSMKTKTLVGEKSFLSGAFQSQFALDPLRTRLFHTATETDTGFVDLKALVLSLGL